MCEHKRERAVRKRFGKPSACVAQRTAFCIELTQSRFMSRQFMCARTRKVCEEIREEARHNYQGIIAVTECRSVLNTDQFTTSTDVGLRHPP